MSMEAMYVHHPSTVELLSRMPIIFHFVQVVFSIYITFTCCYKFNMKSEILYSSKYHCISANSSFDVKSKETMDN